MKKYMKRILGCALSATMLLPVGLTACKKGGSSTGGEGGGNSGTVNISFSYPENGTNKASWNELIKAYNDGQGKTDGVYVVKKNTGVEVPTSSLFTKGIDYAYNVIACSDTQNAFQYLAIQKDTKKAPNGYFLDLTPYAEADADFKNNTINPEMLNWWKMTYNKSAKQGAGQPKHVIGAGQSLLGVPYGTAQQYNWYNAKLFREQGINIISVEEEKLDEYNTVNGSRIMPHGYAEYAEAPFKGAVSSKNSAGETVYKVFNNCIGMNWEEQRILFRYFTKAYNSASSTNYGFISEYWFNYGWSIGGDVMGYNGTDYDFTLMDKSKNYIVTQDNVTINGVIYNAGDILRYEDRVNESTISSLVTATTLVELPSMYDAIKEYLSLQIGVSTTVDGTDKGYGIASPDTGNMLNAFTNESVAMVRRNNSWSFNEVAGAAKGANFDVCVPEQYREYVGGSVYQNGAGFTNEHLKVIGKTYGGVVYTGELRKENGTPIVGKKTTAGNTMGLVIPACSDPKKYQASWDFISWVATEGQQYIAKSITHSPLAADVLFSDKYSASTNNALTKGKDMKVLAITAYNAGRGDWGYFENGNWVTNWANDFNNNVRQGRKTMSAFLTTNAAKGKTDLNNMSCIIKGIR